MNIRANVVSCKGSARHFQGSDGGATEVGRITKLEIKEANGPMFYLFLLDEKGDVLADSCHFSLEEAKEQADFEFEIDSDGWSAVPLE